MGGRFDDSRLFLWTQNIAGNKELQFESLVSVSTSPGRLVSVATSFLTGKIQSITEVESWEQLRDKQVEMVKETIDDTSTLTDSIDLSDKSDIFFIS